MLLHSPDGSLTLRDALPSDAPQLAAWWNDGAVMAHAGFPNGLNEDPRDIAARLATDDDHLRRRLIIEEHGRPIGEMSYHAEDSRTAEIGIKICDFSRQDHGLGKRLLSMLIRALFCDLGFERIVLDTNLSNLRAQHVYERLGFTRVRVDHDSWRDQLGRLQSSVHYELTPPAFHDFSPPDK